MDSKSIIKCINTDCGQQLAVPNNRGTIKVKCARCQAQWLWSPPEVRELHFRCATTAAHFRVAFGRSHPGYQYRIVGIAAVPPAEEEKVPSANSALSKLGQLSRPIGDDKRPNEAEPTQAFDIKDFDFGGWYCPCCGYARDGHTQITFVRCGTCGGNVCGARVVQVSSEISTYECHDECRGSGRLQAAIETMNGVAIESASAAASTLRDKGARPLSASTESLRLI